MRYATLLAKAALALVLPEGGQQDAQFDWDVHRARNGQRSHRWMLDATSIDAAGIGSVFGSSGRSHCVSVGS
jgi:hypothetical protein